MVSCRSSSLFVLALLNVFRVNVPRGEQRSYRHLVFQFAFDNESVYIAEVKLRHNYVFTFVGRQWGSLHERSTVVHVDDIEESTSQESLDGDLKIHERHMIIDALEKSAGSRKTAAEKLGISPRTLRYKLARMRDAGISVPAA